MPVKTKVVLKEAGSDLAWAAQDWEVFELPAPGDRLWYKRWAVRVESVHDDAEQPRIDLAFDWERDKALHSHLPSDSHIIEAGQRPTDGAWTARVIDAAVGRIVSEDSGDSCDGAIGKAISAARSNGAGRAA